MTRVIHVETDRSFSPEELMAAVHWGQPQDYPLSAVAATIESYHFIGHVRDGAGMLVGYVCAFSDGVFATFVGELVVHPAAQGSGVGAALLDAVEAAYPGVAVFALGFRDARGFFAAQGYSAPPRPIEVLTKLATWPATEDITLRSASG